MQRLTLALFAAIALPQSALAVSLDSLVQNFSAAEAGECSGSYCVAKGGGFYLRCEYQQLPDGNCKTQCYRVEDCSSYTM